MRLRCWICNGSGRTRCTSCNGTGQLKWFIQLTVVFDIQEDDFIKKSEDVPDEKLRNCQAITTFIERFPRVREFYSFPSIFNNIFSIYF
jgi:hypothetical protein